MSSVKINIVTLGCSKNLVDSEIMMARMNAGGYTTIHDGQVNSSRIAIINTCGFISDAREESIDTILRFAEARKAGDIDKLYVMGCLAQRYMVDLKKEIPEVDSYFGVNNIEDIIKELSIDNHYGVENNRIITGPGHYAYLKVSEGCDRSCSFCAIPMIRGAHRSRKIEDITEEAEYLAGIGVKELILIAQDLTYYGKDLYGKRRIDDLVSTLALPEYFDRIRLHYLYPSNFPMSLLSVIRNIPEVCRYIDIPIQHINGKVLRLMNRSHSHHDTIKLLYQLREEIPGSAIRTTLIVGHPGETEKEFMELYDFVRDFRFDRMGVFAYSHEEGTPGWKKYSDETSSEIKNERVSALMELQQGIAAEINAGLIGSTLPVIFDRREGEWLIGRTEFDSPEIDQEVLVPNKTDIETGTILPVKITGSGDFDLFGEIATMSV